MSAEQPVQSSTTIVILDDDKLSTHNLLLQFRFMGEHPRSIASDNWRSLLQNLKAGDDYRHLLAIVIGQVNRNSFHSLLASLRDYDSRLPVLVVDDKLTESEGAALESGAGGNQVRMLGWSSLTYEGLKQALDNAAAYSGRKRQESPSAIISSGGAALFRSLSGSNPGILALRELIPQVAVRNVTVLIMGESGAGKEVVARNIHYHSGRRGKPFIAVNCAALIPAGMGAELFGCEDQLNGQARIQAGLLEQADGGTVFFDQISELPLKLQAVLLRFLEDQQFQRIGGYQQVRTDVRVIAGTRHSLEVLVAEDKFRKDLYYRLNAMPLQVPPLRERLEDIPELIRELIASLESKGYPAIRLNASAMQSLQRHDWPGNVRELANLIERLGIIQPGLLTGISDLPAQYQYFEADTETVASAQVAAQVNEGASSSGPQQTQEEMRPVTAAVNHLPEVGGESRSNTSTVAYSTGPHPGPGALILPLDPARLQHYLASFERQLLQTALDDCAGLLTFTAERLELDETALQDKLRTCSLPD